MRHDQPAVTSQVADQFHYKLAIESQGRQKMIRTTEADTPEDLQPLFEWLTEKARRPAR